MIRLKSYTFFGPPAGCGVAGPLSSDGWRVAVPESPEHLNMNCRRPPPPFGQAVLQAVFAGQGWPLPMVAFRPESLAVRP
jgi:hypothetical protein